MVSYYISLEVKNHFIYDSRWKLKRRHEGKELEGGWVPLNGVLGSKESIGVYRSL